MSRPIVVLALAILGLLQTVAAVDLSQTKNVQIDFTEKDIVPKTALKNLLPETYAATGFIGNIEIGRRYADETVFRRVIVFNNPTDRVQSTTLTLSVTNGILHYTSVVNDNGSYAVACDEPTTLGSSKGKINIRGAPNTRSSITIIAAAH
ncbi:PREDICTED: uncharacterized protein LOC105621509 [Atta cephalotes]|uniref:Uncharacterized protein n=2 Tax=Atta TaxID=12956 RepID=A0A158NLG1_ATTCE|nr:PREDICTED: uncharacterized protein LOC105621509 [Atta cephalotes]XP_018053994.1 PREDICTED: uncharacterized protein LOC108690949 [Atta colombica]KYM78372.1 hypothetical protein ALC53_11027 [Atta colombica]